MHRVRLCLRGEKRTGQDRGQEEGGRGGKEGRRGEREEGAMGKRSGKKWSRQTTV